MEKFTTKLSTQILFTNNVYGWISLQPNIIYKQRIRMYKFTTNI